MPEGQERRQDKLLSIKMLGTISMFRAAFWSLSLCVFCCVADAGPSGLVATPPAIAVPAMIDSAIYAEVLIGSSFSTFTVGPPTREVVAVHDKAWICRFASHLRGGSEVKHWKWKMAVSNAPVEFILQDGNRLVLLAVGGHTIWECRGSSGMLQLNKDEGDALASMIKTKADAGRLATARVLEFENFGEPARTDVVSASIYLNVYPAMDRISPEFKFFRNSLSRDSLDRALRWDSDEGSN
jgi:hypothetical protein